MEKGLDKKAFGAWCEDFAERWFLAKGCEILERNFRCREGEIDLIVRVRFGLRFVEVKGRRGRKFGGVVEALTREKTRRMRKAIWRWREARGNREFGEIWFLGILVGRDGRISVEEMMVE
jgi:putative endonuclease